MASPLSVLPNNTEYVTYLTCGQKLGLLITTEAGFISTTAVLILFCMIIRNVLRNIRTPPQGGWRFFRSPLDVYMLSLLIADFLQGVGGLLDAKWVNRGVVQSSHYCTAQGVIQQLGETSVAMTTLAIAVHTFVIILFRKGSEAVKLASLVVCSIWLFIIIFVAVTVSTHSSQNFEAPTPYWCWIGSKYLPFKIAGEYFWIWFTAVMSICLYIPLFFCLRGNIEVEGERWWKIRFRRRPKDKLSAEGASVASLDSSSFRERHQGSRDAAREAFNMLLYPVCYGLTVAPLSIVRWIDFAVDANAPDPMNVHEKMPSAVTFMAVSIFTLSGLVNVVLLLLTRPGLLLISQPAPAPAPAPGPVFESSASVTSSTRELAATRLRALNTPVLNMDGWIQDSRQPRDSEG